MNIPLQITFRNFNRSDAVAQHIEEKVRWLEKYCNYLISCRVTVELLSRRHHQGNLFSVHIDMKLPGGEVAAVRNPHQDGSHEDLYVTIRDAFRAARRRLEDYSRRHRIRVHQKHREQMERGKVIRILRGDGEYGFLQTPEGREIYFNRNSVLNQHFDDLEIGSQVRFVEEMGDEGPQASTVELIA